MTNSINLHSDNDKSQLEISAVLCLQTCGFPGDNDKSQVEISAVLCRQTYCLPGGTNRGSLEARLTTPQRERCHNAQHCLEWVTHSVNLLNPTVDAPPALHKPPSATFGEVIRMPCFHIHILYRQNFSQTYVSA